MSKSSSDDESFTQDQHRFHIQLPQRQINLQQIRKQNSKKTQPSNLAKKATSNFVKATKIKSSKQQYPDSYTPKDPKASVSSSRHNSTSESSDDGENDSDSIFRQHINIDKQSNLPQFKFTEGDFQKNTRFDDESESEGSDEDLQEEYNPAPEFYQYDSSDEDEEEEENNNEPEVPIERKQSHKSVKSTNSRKSSTSLSHLPPPQRHETNKSTESNKSKDSGVLKGILRKMSLADRSPIDELNQDMSHSDTFLGRVLQFGSQSQQGGLSGGGLVPGATKCSDSIPEEDEEKKVGFAINENDRDIEMKPINYDDLSEEAKQLIHQHIPDLHSRASSATNSNTVTPNISTDDLLKKREEDINEKQTSTASSAENPFYTPNPDLYLRGGHGENNENENENHPPYEAPTDFLQDLDGDYIAPPKQVQAGVLSSLLRLYQNPQDNKSASSLSRQSTNFTSDGESYESDSDRKSYASEFKKIKSGVKGVQKAPGKMYNKVKGNFKHDKNTPQHDLDSDNDGEIPPPMDSNLPSFQNAKPKVPKKKPTDIKLKKLKHSKRKAERLRITVHIADILQRQKFIMNMCRALMLFGAPTHRLEEYMIMTSRVLEIDGQFMYFPGCMLVSFGDAATRTSEVHLVRCAQGLNLSKLADTHKIYKAVIHDLIGVEDASKKLDELLKSKNLYPPWLCVLFYGIGSLAVTPFAFEGGWIDLPISFGVGLCVGYLQFYVSSMSNLYSSVFEVSAAIVVAFISRGIGSIRSGNLFCFSAITQGSLALILPGYIILCGSLELQSRNLVAGSVRMFYAIIYSLFLGFGITLGSALYGWVDHNATSQNSCQSGHSMNDKFRILFVPMFATMLGLINQARWKQLPMMIFIASVGYIGTYFAGKHFSNVTEFTACIGAFIVGILGNLYSRIWKGMAVSAMLPAIFVQVPSGIASKSTLISGIATADQITSRNGTTTTTDANDKTSSLSFGATMVEVSIGISVGLFAAALVVYPFGKKRTGLFTL
ncbi:unnamed protein product [Candida verbasci]|uniref:Pheromone-regulated membrane protein 10 n=1 Tax=Candida verbasci TaxID=1227364 RepID=A0A9W4TZ09_9ASCO|nr:unnamed protein product [Candida verbasci]